MSNYLLVISSQEAAVATRSWLSRYSSDLDAELMQFEVNEDRWVTYVSRNPVRECRMHDGVIFKGYAIDYARESMALGAEGFAQYLAIHRLGRRSGESIEGCYFSARWTGAQAEIRSDLFAQCPVLYFADSAVAAVSDSMYILANLRRALGLRCSLHERSVIGRSWGNAMAGQMLGEDTLVEEIKFAPVGTSLVVSFSPEIRLAVKRRSVLETFAPESDNYTETVRLSAQRIASSIQTFSGLSGDVARLAVSGGMDSRVCLAAALLSEAGRGQAAFNCMNTSSSHAKDYQVVSSLSGKFGFPLGLRTPPASVPRPGRRVPELGLWFLANAGLYDFMYVMPAINTGEGAVSIGGHGAELHKGNYGWRTIRTIANAIPDRLVSDAFLSQCESGIAAMGVRPDDAFGSEWHYLGFRNAIHSGRFVTGTMAGFRPLMTRSLVALSRSSLNEWIAPKKGGQSLISDLLICLSPALASEPFDDEKKNLAASVVAERSSYLGGGLMPDEIVEYRVFGSLAGIVSGCPDVFAALVAERHGANDLDRPVLLRLVQENYGRLSGRVREVYGPTLAEATTKLAADKLSVSQMRASIGKLLSFELVD
ncbi:hypothetical protein FZO89_13180 [Luteimonas viscosa]|uniref:Asparagine synthase (Glutamine-hydrolysing) n=1 Tax=Luteimonas viscosa TaxID=1132694 RepID=A0A5D4XSS8_9GAMM|nr:hypothetical protein [Luteimonas viscosa]TYT27134.1 hypothetical protein FZO89_13180 [Luteimonas viscosa]